MAAMERQDVCFSPAAEAQAEAPTFREEHTVRVCHLMPHLGPFHGFLFVSSVSAVGLK